MPNQIAVTVPNIGENVKSGKVVAIHVALGDAVEVDQSLIDLETDKAVVEIPSPVKGNIAQILVKVGNELKIGDTVAQVESAETSENKVAQSEQAAQQTMVENRLPVSEPVLDELGDKPEPIPTPAAQPHMEETRPLVAAAPSIRKLARELGVDIYAVKGTGPGGRISESDIKAQVKQQLAATGASVSGLGTGETPPLPDFSRWGPIDIQEIPTVRRLTAESTALSWRIVPHVTQFDEADITKTQEFIRANATTASQSGAKLTITAVLAKICATALVKFPHFNASINPQGNQIIFKNYVHIGIAVDTSRGLLMPVVTDAHNKSITELAIAIADLADRARKTRIKPEELEGGTFSISNQGSIGGANFTPVILWPQVAILGVSRATVRPSYSFFSGGSSGSANGRWEPRTILPLALSYDHRIIDGADAARFLSWICECLKQPMTMHL